MALLLTGCTGQRAVPEPIPHYADADAETTLAAVRARLAGLHAVQGEATVELTDATRQTVRLDAAFLLSPPGAARLRAWKFGQAVFDLTVKDGRAWAFVPRDQAKPAVPGTREALARWSGLLGSADVLRGDVRTDGDTFVVTRPAEHGMTLRIAVDRPTRTPRQYTLADDRGVTRFSLTLADYRPAGTDQLWPTTITAVSEAGTIVVRSHDVQVNGDLPASAFTPPRRAEELP